MNKLIAITAMLTCGLLQFTSATKASELPDMYECGSEAYPDCPNSPLVWMYFQQTNNDHPSNLKIFFINKLGKGIFRDVTPTKRSKIEKDWSNAKLKSKTYCFWGECASERLERKREKYYIDIRFEKKYLKAYKVSGPHLSNPEWVEIETEEKKK